MRTEPALITAERTKNASALCMIWSITRTDGAVLRFTEHDHDLSVASNTYLSTASFDATAIKASADFAVDDLSVQGAFDSSLISADDLKAGRYNGASFFVAEVIWSNPSAGMAVKRFGWLGRIIERGGVFVAELLSPQSRLQQPLLNRYSPTCRRALGDAQCGVALGPFTNAGTVLSVGSNRAFVATGVPHFANDHWNFGTVEWTSGLNIGLKMEVRQSLVVTVLQVLIDLFLPMPFPVAITDTFTITRGCNKSITTCETVFSNVLNFRGEPHVPVSDDTVRGPTR